MSGLIFVALALVWAVVLIPKALRHHDEVAKTRPVDTVSDSLRVLSRRDATNPATATATDAAVEAVAASIPAPREPARHVPGPRIPEPRRGAGAHPAIPRRTGAAVAARRRRRVLALLLAATLGVTVATVVGALAPWAPILPVVAVLGFLVVARVTVRRELARRAAASARRRAEAVETVETVAAVVEAATDPVESAPLAPAAPVVAATTALDDTAAISVAALLDGLESTADAGSLWDPLPVTLPTYVTKPRATRSVRTIELSDPGVASSGRDAADSALVAEAATAAAAAEGTTRRAVGS